MKANQFSLARATGLLAGALALIATGWSAEADALPTFDSNYIKVSATGVDMSDNKAAFQARTQTSKNGAAGIEAFNYSYDVSKDSSLEINGRIMPVSEDYLGSFKLAKNEFGSIEVGYKQFRTYYDGAGGFFPLTNAWLPTYPRELYVDRGNFFVNGTLSLPNAPVLTFKYSNASRDGRKDSTIWGDTNLTGLTSSPGKKILPNYIDLNERNETWEISARHTIGNTTVIGTVGGDRINNNDFRTVDRNVGEVKAFGTTVQVPATVSNSLLGNQTRGLDAQGFKENGTFFAGKIETVVNDKLTVFGGVNYRHATETITGSRLISATVATATGTQNVVAGYWKSGSSYTRPAYSYTSTGNLKQDILTGDVGVDLKPAPTLNVKLAVRAEQYKDSGHVDQHFQSTLVDQTTGVDTARPVETYSNLKNNEKPWTPEVDVRYTGISNIALYGNWQYRTVSQNERNDSGSFGFNTANGAVSGPIEAVTTHIEEKHSNITLGANWTPLGNFSARAEVFSKDHENSFRGYDLSEGALYILDYDIIGAKLTAVVKPTPALAFTTRYIIQTGKASVSDDYAGKGDSGDSKRHQLSETVDWTPNKSFYLQANASLVFDTIITSYPRVNGTAQWVNHNADNNYWNGSVIAGFPVEKNTDLQLQGTYYRADNYNPALGLTTLPYGMSTRDYSLTAGVKHKFGPKTLAEAKVGYLDSNNETSGGYWNYRGPLAYVAVSHSF